MLLKMKNDLNKSWFWVGLALLVFSILPYFFKIIPDSLYEVYLGLINLLFAILIVYVLYSSRIIEKLKSLKALYYSFVILAVSGFLMILEGIGFNVLGLDDTLLLVAYFLFIVTLYLLFEDVYIKKTPLKIAVSLIFTLLVILLFSGNIELVLASKIGFITKLFAIIPPIIDVILLAGLISILIMVHTNLFFKTYGLMLAAVFFMFLSDFLSIPINASGAIIPFNFADIFTIIAYFCAFLFILRQSFNLKNLKPTKKV